MNSQQIKYCVDCNGAIFPNNVTMSYGGPICRCLNPSTEATGTVIRTQNYISPTVGEVIYTHENILLKEIIMKLEIISNQIANLGKIK